MGNNSIVVNNPYYDELPLISSQPLTSEILVYCQNLNRMRSALKISEIHKKVLSSSFQIILGTETSWNENVKSEEIFGSNYNVFRDNRDLNISQRMSGGGVFVAVSSEFNSELIPSLKFKEFDHVC